MKIDKIGITLGAIILALIVGCSENQQQNKENNQSQEKKELSTDMSNEVINPLYAINNKEYDVKTLPLMYQNIKGQKRKLFLDKYINYKLTLDSLTKEQEIYQTQIDSNIKKELSFIADKGVVQDELIKTLLLQKITLETIGLEEVAKNRPSLDKEIDAFYKKHQKEYSYPNNIEISFIAVKDKNQSQELLNELKNKPFSIKKFALLAQENSLDIATGMNGGYAGFMTEEESGKTFFDTVWNIKKTGLVNHIIERDKRFFLIYIHKKNHANSSQLNQVKEDIREYLLKKARNKWIQLQYNKIMKTSKVKIFDSFEDNLTW